MSVRSLADWLFYQERLHPSQIELGLERVQKVFQKLIDQPFNSPVIIIGGTNGKGSTIACLESIYRSAGYTTGSYTSPHILRYNERIRINGQSVDDETLVRAFEHIENCREDISLTYFEFGTLAALLIFYEAMPDILLLEVGLGGRLDAVNIMDPDVSIISSIALDHTDWLGTSIEQIALEKAGIARGGKPLIYGAMYPPESLMKQAGKIGADFYRINDEFGYNQHGKNTWMWWGNHQSLPDLPLPTLIGEHQLANCSAAIQAVMLLDQRLPVPVFAIKQGLSTIQLAGRFEIVQTKPMVIHDVAHNAAAGEVLASMLNDQHITGKTHAIVGMQSSRQPDDFIRSIAGQVNYWYACTLSGNAVHSSCDLSDSISKISPVSVVTAYKSVAEGLQSAMANVRPEDRIIVTGSFLTVAQAKATEHV
ncbi:MAG: bifunctional tetrahydrofolate synthase/dihydrofolate synthase [Gammaproteobacteria bacterium]|nr:MAG: bifunctional tetrahydrofolate synthase/dihydrofolate synthase [Gammaproteobacteria bacterium]